MESELAKTLRSMSDDHRMVPDFSEKLLDIADAIELRGAHDAMEALAKALTKTEQERDAALVEVERMQKELDVASPAEAERYREAYLEKTRELEAAQAEVERQKKRVRVLRKSAGFSVTDNPSSDWHEKHGWDERG